MDIGQIQAYAYFGFTALLVVLLYGYIYHLYSTQKKGERDYEKYGNMALDDDITSDVIEENPKRDEDKKGA